MICDDSEVKFMFELSIIQYRIFLKIILSEYSYNFVIFQYNTFRNVNWILQCLYNEWEINLNLIIYRIRFLFDIEFEFKAISSSFFQFNWEKKKDKKNFVEWNELGNTKSRIKELRNFHTHTLRANAENTTESIKTAYIRPIYSHTLL